MAVSAGMLEDAVPAMRISNSVGEVFKEIQRRYELRQLLQAEGAEETSDEEFLGLLQWMKCIYDLYTSKLTLYFSPASGFKIKT